MDSMHKQRKIYEGEDPEGLISFGEVVSTLWRARWTILIVSLLAMICGLLWSLVRETYVSQGVYQFSEAATSESAAGRHISRIQLVDYNRYAMAIMKRDRFDGYVRDQQLEPAEGINIVRALIGTSKGISHTVEPVLLPSKSTGSGSIEITKDGGSSVIGVQVTYASDSPEVSPKVVAAFGNYVMDSMIHFGLSDIITRRRGEVQSNLAKLENQSIEAAIELKDFRNKADSLRKVIARHPNAALNNTHSFMAISENMAHYLPPITLLLATEVKAGEADNLIPIIRREQMQSSLWLEYYDRVRQMLHGTKSGKTALYALGPIKEGVCKSRDISDLAVQQVCNAIASENQAIVDQFMEGGRVMASPSLPLRSTARPLLAAVVGLLIGLMLSLLIVFVRRWMSDAKMT